MHLILDFSLSPVSSSFYHSVSCIYLFLKPSSSSLLKSVSCHFFIISLFYCIINYSMFLLLCLSLSLASSSLFTVCLLHLFHYLLLSLASSSLFLSFLASSSLFTVFLLPLLHYLLSVSCLFFIIYCLSLASSLLFTFCLLPLLHYFFLSLAESIINL